MSNLKFYTPKEMDVCASVQLKYCLLSPFFFESLTFLACKFQKLIFRRSQDIVFLFTKGQDFFKIRFHSYFIKSQLK